MFRLNNLPGRYTDLRDCIGRDSYGHPAYDISTPQECRYNWQAPPPHVPQAVLDNYGSCSTTHTIVPIHEVLGVSEIMLLPEATRVNFFQEILKCGMGLRRAARSIRYLEKVPNRDEIPNELLSLGRALVGLSRGPFIYSKDNTLIIPEDEDGYTWLDPHTCLRITTHLDDEKNLRATITEIVKAVMERPNMQGIVYGIGFSLFHCVIVRINVDDHGSFNHTPALQFLPSFYTHSPSTPGITALVRLGYMLEPLELLRIPPGILPRAHLLNNMPLELWSHIAHDLFSLNDIITLGTISPAAWSAANAVLKSPLVGESRVVNVKSDMSFNRLTEFEVIRDEEISDRVEGEEVLDRGALYFRSEWDKFACEYMNACSCVDGRPWAMPYVCHFRLETWMTSVH
jgi:hypothetical protein